MASLGSVAATGIPAQTAKLGELGNNFEQGVKRLRSHISRLQSANERIAGPTPPSPLANTPTPSPTPSPTCALAFLANSENELRLALTWLDQEIARVEEL